MIVEHTKDCNGIPAFTRARIVQQRLDSGKNIKDFCEDEGINGTHISTGRGNYEHISAVSGHLRL